MRVAWVLLLVLMVKLVEHEFVHGRTNLHQSDESKLPIINQASLNALFYGSRLEFRDRTR
jgi:hypothetical protein